MKDQFNWDEAKNQAIKQARNISFNDVVDAVEAEQVLSDRPHPNTEKYPHQRVLTVNIQNYAYFVPYVTQEDGKKFLKTIYASRKETKKFIK